MSFIRSNYYVEISEEMLQRERSAKDKCDFNAAISIAQSWLIDVRNVSGFAEDKALGRLYEAITFKPNNVDKGTGQIGAEMQHNRVQFRKVFFCITVFLLQS